MFDEVSTFENWHIQYHITVSADNTKLTVNSRKTADLLNMDSAYWQTVLLCLTSPELLTGQHFWWRWIPIIMDYRISVLIAQNVWKSLMES